MPQFRYVDNSTGTVSPYLELATQYGWANRMFQTNQGPSYPAHQFLFGGTSAPSDADDVAGNFVTENLVGTGAVGGFKKKAGCASPADTKVEVDGPSGKSFIYPCFEHKTMPDLFPASVSWQYYAPSPGTIWTAPNSIKHICQSTGPGGKCVGPMWTKHLRFHPPYVVNDIAACKLRSVSWVIPAGPYSDHAGPSSGAGGPAWVASIVNAIGKSTSCDGGKGYWNDTAIFVTWDDWGGWYDHVAPPILPLPQGAYQYGFRVPLLVVSAYTPKGYVNNVDHDFGSILRFVQHNFGIPEGALTFADQRSKSDLRAFFDFTAPPRAFEAIPAPSPMPAHVRDHTAPDNG
jgi:phospholipase C